MFLIAFRIITLLAIAYLFGLLFAWLFSLFNSSNGGGDDFRRGDDPDNPQPPDSEKTLEQKKGKKRLVEVDESYYLEEFDLSKKQ
ncbi:MAG: LapA family protein [Xenococcaceae cyanobacterium]